MQKQAIAKISLRAKILRLRTGWLFPAQPDADEQIAKIRAVGGELIAAAARRPNNPGPIELAQLVLDNPSATLVDFGHHVCLYRLGPEQ